MTKEMWNLDIAKKLLEKMKIFYDPPVVEDTDCAWFLIVRSAVSLTLFSWIHFSRTPGGQHYI